MRALPFQVTTQSATTFESGAARVTVRSRAVRFSLLALGHYGNGFIWNRPFDIIIERPGSAAQRIPIHDTTRLAMLALFGVGLLGSWVIGIGMRRRA
jgi:hypothetical protein